MSHLEKLDVFLPKDVNLGRPRISPSYLRRIEIDSRKSKLTRFGWRGQPDNLPLPWRSLSKLPFRQLTSIELHCDIGINDCFHILDATIAIQEFEVHWIKDCVASTWPSPWTSSDIDIYKQLRDLHRLKVSSAVSVGPIFRTFDIKNLKRFSLTLAREVALDIHPEQFLIDWKDLNYIHLRGAFLQPTIDEFRRSCSIGAEFTFEDVDVSSVC